MRFYEDRKSDRMLGFEHIEDCKKIFFLNLNLTKSRASGKDLSNMKSNRKIL